MHNSRLISPFLNFMNTVRSSLFCFHSFAMSLSLSANVFCSVEISVKFCLSAIRISFWRTPSTMMLSSVNGSMKAKISIIKTTMRIIPDNMASRRGSRPLGERNSQHMERSELQENGVTPSHQFGRIMSGLGNLVSTYAFEPIDRGPNIV